MNFAEKASPASGVVVNKSLEVPSAANAEVFVSPDDLRRRGWWANKDGVRVRVDADKLTLTEYTPGAQPVLQGSLEEIAEKFRAEGFAFFPIEGDAPEKNKVQVPVREEDVSKEAASDPDREKRLAEDEQLDQKIDQSIKEVEAIAEKIKSFISEANTLSQEEGFEAIRVVLDDITSQAEGKIELVNNFSVVDDTADAGVAIDEAYIEAKRKRFERLQELCGEMDTLGEQAARALESLKKLSSEAVDREAPPIVSAKGGGVTGEPEKGGGESKKRLKRKVVKGGGSGGGEDDTNVSSEEKRRLKKKARLLDEEQRRQAEGVPVPDEASAPSAEPVVAEVPVTDTAWRQELDAFLERPKAREKVAMIEDIIREEWSAFTGRIATVASEKKAFVSDQEMMRLWQRYGLGELEDMVARYLEKSEGMPPKKGRTLFQMIVRNLDELAQSQE